MIELTCPKCGAELKTDKKRDTMFCEYCGHKIMTDRINIKIDHNITYRKVDEAKIKREEKRSEVLNAFKDIVDSIGEALFDIIATILSVVMIIIMFAFLIYTRTH